MRLTLEEAARRLRAGEIVAFPTETVYGLGADATNEDAVLKIFETKARPRFDPLIVHVPDVSTAQTLSLGPWEPRALALAEAFWPGPLTLVLPKGPLVPDLVTAGLETFAVRVPDHPTALELLRLTARPLAAPSANRFGRLSPTTAEAVESQLGPGLPLLDAGPCRVGVESTVVSLARSEAMLLRPGGLPREEIEAVVGHLQIPTKDSLQRESPGRSIRHYAPRTPLRWRGREDHPRSDLGLLQFGTSDEVGWGAVEDLSPDRDLRKAARRLYEALRRLDGLGLRGLRAEPVPDEGLGQAINDRLEKAMQP
ncbi:MAG: L-threonylcarbamoyladenylate synthase [Myxococcota bacterium]